MLTEEQWNEALQNADKAVGRCTRFCRYGVAFDGGVPKCFHNGLGNSDSDETAVHAATALALSPPSLETRFRAWLESLHQHRSYDLNTGA